MIVSRIVSGLGNQLFQYAAGLALARRLGVPLRLDLRSFRVDKVRKYELGPYNLSATARNNWSLPPSPRRALRRRLWQAAHPHEHVFNERRFEFDPNVLSLPDGTHLHGLFQCEQYFEDAAEAVRADFTLRYPLSGKAQEIMAHIRGVASVSLHVRRGDYVAHAQTRAEFGTLGIEYYRAALTTIVGRMGTAPTVFIFSDEPEWTRQNIVLPYVTEVVASDAERPPAHDLALMSACQHQVIANSSFSWWGAWLNPSPDKTVVAPKEWFANSPLNGSTIVPPEWLRL